MEKAQLYWEDIQEGMDIPVLVKHPTTRQLVKWAGASGEFHETHYDKDFALKANLPSVVLYGSLTFSFLIQMLTDWIGEEVWVKKAGVSYRAVHVPGEDLFCKGKVTKKLIEDGEHIVECQVWAENPRGEKTTPGSAILKVPSRRSK